MTQFAAEVGVGAGLLGAAGAAGAAYAVFSPRSRWCIPLIRRGESADRVALTFDDGPGPRGTARILDALRDLGVPAAFFVIGANVDRYPELVRRMHDEGHLIANHTYDHLHWGALRPPHWWDDQLRRTDRAIERATGLRPKLFRPPLGIKSWWMAGPLARAGLTPVTWSRRAFDGLARTRTEQILQRLVAPSMPGDILLLHDGEEPGVPRDPSATVAAVEPLVQSIRARGMEFERVDRLLGLEPYFPASGGVDNTEVPVAAGRD